MTAPNRTSGPADRVVPALAQDPDRLRRRFTAFPNARTAIGAFLTGAGVEPGDVVLLPAYIGWSPREGSGVLDPITALGARIEFYRVDGFVRIDLDHLERALKASRPKAVLLIHFFGFCDPQYAEAVALARQEGALVLEDEAHAMFSDLVGGHCGRLGGTRLCSRCTSSFRFRAAGCWWSIPPRSTCWNGFLPPKRWPRQTSGSTISPRSPAAGAGTPWI